MRYIDRFGLSPLDCLGLEGDDLLRCFFEDSFGPEETFIERTASAAGECITCFVKCEAKVLLTELGIMAGEKALHKAAEKIAKEWAEKGVKVVGKAVKVLFLYKTAKCVVNCS
jgi:hypothetical protein